MKTIKNYRTLIRHLRHSEHFDFFRRIVEYLLTRITNFKDIVTVWTLFFGVFSQEDGIFKRSLKAMETKSVNDADQKRNDAYLVIRYGIESAVHSEDTAKKTAADKLSAVLETYRKITSAAITEVSSLVYNLVQDLRLAKYEASVTLLELDDAVDTLEARNQDFDAIYGERMEHYNTLENQGAMKDVRPLVDKAFDDLAQAINSVYGTSKLTGNAEAADLYEAAIDFINADILQYRHIYARRNPGHPVSGTETPPDLETPPTEAAPSLTVLSQTAMGSTGDTGLIGRFLFLEIKEEDLFAELIAPVAVGGILKLTAADIEDYSDFPIEEIQISSPNEEQTGLYIAAPRDRLGFAKPFMSIGDCNAAIYKDGKLLANLSNAKYPAMEGW
jgi:hypothetical protein